MTALTAYLVIGLQGLIIGGLPVSWTDFVNGAVLITVVALSRIMRRRAS